MDIFDKFGNNLMHIFTNKNKYAKNIKLNISDAYEWEINNKILLNKMKTALLVAFLLKQWVFAVISLFIIVNYYVLFVCCCHEKNKKTQKKSSVE